MFLCREVLRLELGSLEQGVRAKRGSKLPVVLTPQEVVELLGGMQGVARLMAELIYGGGLRVMECCRLRVKDLDFDNNLVFVREAIRQIQEYLGHVHVETTMIYTHVVKDMRNPAKSPLDVLRSIKMA
ncbi:MAG: tyrosine-type recombinase/integrase [bacterium]